MNTISLHGQTITPALEAAWKQDRQLRIGASDSATAIGMNSFDSMLRLWLVKMGRLPGKEETESMHIGKLMEPVLETLYQERTGDTVVRKQVYFIKDFMCATLDGIDSEGYNVEFKNVGAAMANRWGPDGTDQVPHEYLVQVLHQMHVSGLKGTRIGALIGGSEFRLYYVNLAGNEAALARVIDLETKFHTLVKTGVHPSPDPERDAALLTYLFSEVTGKVTFTKAQTKQVEQWEILGQKITAMGELREQLKFDILMALGDNAVAELDDGRSLTRSITRVAAQVINRKAYRFPVLKIVDPLLAGKGKKRKAGAKS